MGLLNLGLSSGRSSIISAAEMYAREGEILQTSMHFRTSGARLSVLISLERADGYHDEWKAAKQLYVFEGHDSNAEGSAGKTDDQLLMYASGKPTENGKFFKAANDFKDGVRTEAMQIQVYEKIDAGVFYDKGIFNLVGAERVTKDGRKVCTFSLRPADADIPETARDVDWGGRMMPAAEKVEAWKRCGGRCDQCGSEANLFFKQIADAIELRCAEHA